MITDTEYPYRPAFSLLTKLLDENNALLNQLPNPSAAPSFQAASSAAFGGNPSQAAAGGLPPAQKGKLEGTLASYLAKYQDPKQADTIMKVQQELDETKIVLVSGWSRAVKSGDNPCSWRQGMYDAVHVCAESKHRSTPFCTATAWIPARLQQHTANIP